MRPTLGEKYLITCDSWFYAPDGQAYRAVFGTVHDVMTAEETLGVKTNSKSTNWYVSIGGMLIAGCQIHYAIQTDDCSRRPTLVEVEYEGKMHVSPGHASRIYFADEPFA